MGCCGSTQAGDDGQSPSRPTTAQQQQQQSPPTTTLTSPLTPFTSTTSRSPASRAAQSRSAPRSSNPLSSASSSSSVAAEASSSPPPPSHERYTAPLALPPRWTSKDRTWTPHQLARERAEFFDTRVTNRPEIWSALQTVCELVRSGDLATAQGILDASGCTLPTGKLVDGCYDETGNLYRVPQVVVSDPANLRRDEAAGEDEDKIRGGSGYSNNIDGDTMIGVSESKAGVKSVDKDPDRDVQGPDEDDNDNDDPEDLLQRRRDEKGKASERDTVQVRCRLSDRGGPDVVIALAKTQHVSSLVRRVQAEGKIPSPLRIRLAYLGRVLDDKETLEAQGWKDGHVINAMVVGG